MVFVARFYNTYERLHLFSIAELGVENSCCFVKIPNLLIFIAITLLIAG